MHKKIFARQITFARRQFLEESKIKTETKKIKKTNGKTKLKHKYIKNKKIKRVVN